MKKTTYIVTRFEIDDGFYVEVSPGIDNKGKELYNFFLCKENYEIKELMFRLYASDYQPSEWEDIIEANVDEYIENFIENMDIEF